jgi:N-acyl-D-aspartate/D-glutamate deacylase
MTGTHSLTPEPAASAANPNALGLLRAGMRAKCNTVDLANVDEALPHMVQDLPRATSRRLMQRSVGIVAAIVDGKVVVRGGELTGKPGVSMDVRIPGRCIAAVHAGSIQAIAHGVDVGLACSDKA